MRKLEEYIIVYFSVFFLLFSTFTSPLIKYALKTRSIWIMLIMAPAALALTLLFAWKIEIKMKFPYGELFKSKRFTIPLLIVTSLSFLILNLLKNNALIFDESIHISITKSILTLPISQWISVFSKIPNPPLPYIIMGFMLSPFQISVHNGRIILSIIASAIPLLLYLMMKQSISNEALAFAIAIGYALNPLFQSQIYLYDFDAFSTLFFIVSAFSFIKAIETKRTLYSLIAGILFLLCAFSKYVPAAWLILGFALVIPILLYRGYHIKLFVPLLVIVASSFTGLAILFPTHYMFLIRSIIGLFPLANYEKIILNNYGETLFWDLIFIFGWAPYLVLLSIIKDQKYLWRNPDKLFITTLVLSALLTPLLNPITRRVIQAVPLFYALTFDYAIKKYSRIVSTLLWLNFSWWGILNLATIIT
jgi:hypothetical protein